MPDINTFTLPAVAPNEALRLASAGATLIDVRKPSARMASGRTVAGAEIRDPFTFGHDDPLMVADGPMIVFCVHGHEVSQFACALLLVHGRNACYVEGGYEALVAAHAPLEDLPQ